MSADLAASTDAPPTREPRRDAWAWRVFATGLAFATFGLGGLVLGLLVFPVMRLLPGGVDAHRRRARRTIQLAFRGFAEYMRILRVLDYRFVGRERLGRPGQLIVANHPSLIDVVFLLGFTPGASCVVKHQLWKNPFTRGPVSAAEYVKSQPTDEMLAGACATLQAGQSVILFPEGTRTTPGQPFHFHRGAASVAVRAATAVTPVYIRCTPTTLTKSEKWYRVPRRRVLITFVVGDDLELTSFRSMPSAPLAARAFNEHMVDRFERELSSG
jgi:1-acyl-sn-glycerol-3-phosphate acyltransferase